MRTRSSIKLFAAASVLVILTLALWANGLLDAQDKQPAKGPAAKKPLRKAEWLDSSRAEPNGTKYRTFPSKLAGSDVSYLVYLPPDYEKQTKRYPVIYWLHGTGGGQQAGANRFIPEVDSAIKQGFLPPVIVVSVNGMVSGWYCDSIDGKQPLESVIVKELIPHVDQTYRTVARREGRVVQGFSMGGYGAAHLGFKYPEVFGTVVADAGALIDENFKKAHVPETFGDDKDHFLAEHPYQLAVKNADKIRGKTNVRIACGSKDGLLARTKELHKILDEQKIEHQYEVVPDVAHESDKYYKLLGTKGLEIHRKAFEALDKAK